MDNYEQLAAISNFAYRHSRNRDNAVALVKHYFPTAPIARLVDMWEAIDAYEDNDTNKYPKLFPDPKE